MKQMQAPDKTQQPIDFRTMLAREKQRAGVKLTLKLTTSVNVFNMLQDMRHLVIVDLRSQTDFDESHVRNAIHLGDSLDLLKSEVAKHLIADQKTNQFRSHFENDDLRRVLFIVPQVDAKRFEALIVADLDDLRQDVEKSTQSQTTIHKAFYFKDFDSEFKQKYPLVCLPTDVTKISEKRKVNAFSRFPSEMKKDFLYLGNMTNILNRDYFQLKMLNIKTIFYLAPKPFGQIDEHFNCVHIETNELEKPTLDMESLSEQVQNLGKDKTKSPVLLLCVSGKLSGALAMKVVLDTNKVFTPELASTFVMQRRYELKDIDSWLFGQIQKASEQKKESAEEHNLRLQKKRSQLKEEEESKTQEDTQHVIELIQKYKEANQDLQDTDNQAASSSQS